MLLVVSPVLHKLPVGALEVKTVELPAVKVLFPEIVGVAGRAVVTLTTEALETADVQVPLITLTV